jgi:hypothetical protein
MGRGREVSGPARFEGYIIGWDVGVESAIVRHGESVHEQQHHHRRSVAGTEKGCTRSKVEGEGGRQAGSGGGRMPSEHHARQGNEKMAPGMARWLVCTSELQPSPPSAFPSSQVSENCRLTMPSPHPDSTQLPKSAMAGEGAKLTKIIREIAAKATTTPLLFFLPAGSPPRGCWPSPFRLGGAMPSAASPTRARRFRDSPIKIFGKGPKRPAKAPESPPNPS